MSRLFLTLVCGPGSYEDLVELYEPIKEHFTGLCCVCHAAPDSMESKYLELSKGAGRITYLPYTGRHDLSRICAVHCGVIENDDLVCQFDCLERLSPLFAASIRELVGNLGQVDAFYYYGKILLYRYHESITFIGSPHEGWTRRDKNPVSIELNKAYPDESQIRLNVRPVKRPVDHFIRHYASYALLPWGSNHYRLGLDGKLNAGELFDQREAARVGFIDLLRELSIKRNVDAVIEYMKHGKMDPRFATHLERDKIWNDVYRRYVLGRLDFADDHDWSNVVKISPIPLGEAKLENAGFSLDVPGQVD